MSNTMTDEKPKAENASQHTTGNTSLWKRHRMPILLGMIALCLYLGSIVWMVYGRGQVGG